ncbi:MAG: alpha/beta fold hydrolase [Caldisericaceae bacterium]|nr:alpha/beta fold hydrolase [Caldisericaceae bacterium]
MKLMKGAEPFSFENDSDTGVLLIQGFTGTTSSVYYWGKCLADHGFNVEGPRLSGHGTKWQDLNNVKYTDWIKDVEDGLKKLKMRSENVFVAGLSMGGTLALYLAENHPDLKGVLLVNHAIDLHDPRLPFLGILKYFIKSTSAIGSDIKDPNEKEIAYERTPVSGAYEMVKLLKKVKGDLAKVSQPVLIFKSREDHVVPLDNAEITLKGISSKDKRIIWLENSYHVATMDFDKDLICSESIKFINEHK